MKFLLSLFIFLFLYKPGAENLSYVTLAITGGAILINEKNLGKSFLPVALIFIGGIAIEIIGTKTGVLFGTYEYGKPLGIKLWGVPIVIGINWVVIVRSAVGVSSMFIKHPLFKALIAALLCTGLDFIIEPVAVQYNFWNWHNDIIPVYNYVCWFIFSFFFSLLFTYQKSTSNPISKYVFLIWAIFFTTLNLL